MSSVLFVTLGSAGDIHPYIAIGAELVKRGHRVAMLTNPVFQERIERCNITFYPLGTQEEYYKVVTNPDLAHPFRSPMLVLRELLGATVDQTLDALPGVLRECAPDVIVRHHISIGSRWVARQHNIPIITCALAPMFFMNPNDTAVLNPWQSGFSSPVLMRLRHLVQRLYLRWFLDRPLNVKRKARGLPPQSDSFRTELLDCERLLGLWSQRFRAAVARDPAHAKICGFATFDDAKPDAGVIAELTEFMLREDGPPILFTLGSSIVHHHNGFYELAAEIVKEQGWRAVMLVGDKANVPLHLTSKILALPYAPYRAILGHARAIVHHGGVGTTGAGLGAGVPSLIIPFANDEFDNAARVERLGAGLQLFATKLSKSTLTAALKKLVSSPSIAQRAKEIGRDMANENGAAIAADEVEAMLSKHRR